jgi:hypothetical protein
VELRSLYRKDQRELAIVVEVGHALSGMTHPELQETWRGRREVPSRSREVARSPDIVQPLLP